jgi:hypothetical protein
MTAPPNLIAGRYQPLDAAKPGAPQRARDLQTAQTVLLRNIKLPSDAADAALARANAAKGIFHPSLVTLFDVVPQPESRGVPFNARRAAELMTELGDAVAELHARGIPHGGISQGTVLITMKGKAKLDRVGDPSLHTLTHPSRQADMQAMGELLRKLVGNAGGGHGSEAIRAAIEGASDGDMQPATFAALLRR